ncbi:MAG: carbonic anhydrase [Patescibacteria group bacterium]
MNKREFLKRRIIVPFASSREHYKADAAIVWCFDDRLSGLLQRFVEEKKMGHKDLVVIAGGLKTLVSPDKESDREFVLGQIQASIKLHAPSKIYLMVHSDCGKYGGLKNFGDDPNKELEHYVEEAKKAKEYLAEHIPENVSVETLFADFSGVYQLD